MKIRDRITKLRSVAFISLMLIPLAVFAVGVKLLMADTLISWTFLITYFLLPLILTASLLLVIFSEWKLFNKIMTTILVLIVFGISFFAVYALSTHEMLSCYVNDEVQEHYTETETRFELMPSLVEIGHTESVEYYDYFSSTFGIFTCDSDILICKYDAENYTEQKSLLADKYTFQSELMTGHGHTCEPSVVIDGYHFRAVSINEVCNGGIDYPKQMIFVATNDFHNEIVYMAFCDDDLDYIESLSDFINMDCGWKHIR